MPLIVKSSLPAFSKLEHDGVPIIRQTQAEHQDIRPLNIGLLNLMPSAVYQKTEEQFFRLLGNTPLQIRPFLVKFDHHTSSKNEGREHLDDFYQPFSKIKEIGLDGLIITGANIEGVSLDEVKFWPELQEIFTWADESVTSTIYSCWSAYTAINFFHGVEKQKSSTKIFGCFEHFSATENALTKNLDDYFRVPHSRFGSIPLESIEKNPNLEVLIQSRTPEVGFHAASTKDFRQVFLQGHPEYDREDLAGEYRRDKLNGQKIPQDYFPENNDENRPNKNWSANAQVFYSNWINFVYQNTGFDLQKPTMD